MWAWPVCRWGGESAFWVLPAFEEGGGHRRLPPPPHPLRCAALPAHPQTRTVMSDLPQVVGTFAW